MARPRSIGARVAQSGVRLAGAGVVLDAMPEATFQREHVVGGLRARRWIVWTVPRMHMTSAGLPDVLAWHPRWPGLLIAWELKRSDGREKPSQSRALAHLRTVPGVDARVVRPRDWPALRDALDSADVLAALRALQEGSP